MHVTFLLLLICLLSTARVYDKAASLEKANTYQTLLQWYFGSYQTLPAEPWPPATH